jgi:ABC-type uncharacterized transport system substrate-binding protein
MSRGQLPLWPLILGLFLALFLGPPGARAAPPRVLLVNGGAGPLHEQVSASLRQALAADREFSVAAEAVDLDGLQRLAAESGRLADFRLVISIGTRATDAVLALEGPTPPLFACFLPRRTWERLLAQYRPDENRVSALVLDQPLGRHLALARLLLGSQSRVGVMLGADSAEQAPQLESLAQRQDLRLQLLQLAPNERPSERFRELLPGLDLVLGLPDPQVFDRVSSKWILYSSYQARVPVLAYSRALVEAGALAAVYSTPEQIGRQAAGLVPGLLAAQPGEAAVVHPDAFDLAVNRAVARSLGLDPPSEARIKKALSAPHGGGD